MDVEYNDKNQTIQGYQIKNARDYFFMKSVISAQHLEGFEPAKEDIEQIYKSAIKTDPDADKELKKQFKDKHLNKLILQPEDRVKWFNNTLLHNGTLKNKLGITDETELAQQEYLLSSIRSIRILEHHPKIKETADIKKIHGYMFEQIYDWAGQYRPVGIQKDGFQFMPPEFFDTSELSINQIISSINRKKKPTAWDYAKLIDELNFMHPFREGNGRSSKLMLECIAVNHHQTITYPQTNDEMIKAQNVKDIEAISKQLKLQQMPNMAG